MSKRRWLLRERGGEYKRKIWKTFAPEESQFSPSKRRREKRENLFRAIPPRPPPTKKDTFSFPFPISGNCFAPLSLLKHPVKWFVKIAKIPRIRTRFKPQIKTREEEIYVELCLFALSTAASISHNGTFSCGLSLLLMVLLSSEARARKPEDSIRLWCKPDLARFLLGWSFKCVKSTSSRPDFLNPLQH